jgi:predicted secreted hydrolase
MSLRRRGLLAIAAAALLGIAMAAAGTLRFPRDHGAHPDVPLEWWYWTGHLQGSAGSDYGFQLTFFRLRDIHLAHFAWSDIASGRFTYEEKTHLALPGIASASESGLELVNEDWGAREENGTQKLRVRTREGRLTLSLSPAKPPVLHGESGISRKGPGGDEYSNYVSITRLNVSGTLDRGGKIEALTGKAWFDHEWGPGGLPSGIAGWDWFALVLDDGSELMLYRMRQTDGKASPFSAGTFVPAASAPRPIGWKDVRLSTKTTWTSPRSKAVYPAVWDLAVASLGLEVTITPLLADQELVTTASTNVTYWEGACRVSGKLGGRPIAGRAYVEMTGYAGRDVPGLGGP